MQVRNCQAWVVQSHGSAAGASGVGGLCFEPGLSQRICFPLQNGAHIKILTSQKFFTLAASVRRKNLFLLLLL